MNREEGGFFAFIFLVCLLAQTHPLFFALRLNKTLLQIFTRVEVTAQFERKGKENSRSGPSLSPALAELNRLGTIGEGEEGGGRKAAAASTFPLLLLAFLALPPPPPPPPSLVKQRAPSLHSSSSYLDESIPPSPPPCHAWLGEEGGEGGLGGVSEVHLFISQTFKVDGRGGERGGCGV